MKVEILSGLWLASEEEVNESKFIINKNITFIINCTTINIDKYITIINEEHHKNIKYLNVPLNENAVDIKKNNIVLLDNMDDLTRMIQEQLNNNKNILIFCKTGITTSLSIIVCYIMRYGKVNIKFIETTLKSLYPTFNISGNKYNYCIKQYYIQLLQKK